MINVEKRNVFLWAAIMIFGFFLFNASFGALFGLYIGFQIVVPVGVELSSSEDMRSVDKEADLTTEQINTIKNKTVEQMRKVSWWLWWPLLNTIAWLITSLFLGFMKVKKYNGGLVVFAYLFMFLKRGNEWNPPGSIIIEVFTILLALVVVHIMSKWICVMRKARA